MMTEVSGGGSPYNDDVGEIQVALNTWGTIHHTGYPLFTITGNIVVTGVRAIGLTPALAPAIHSLVWGLTALTILYLLLIRLHVRYEIAALAIFTAGLARTIWAHNVIAEVYSMSAAIIVLLLAVALLPNMPIHTRLLWLALIGGFGIAHHRMIAFCAPGLILAVLPDLWHEWKRDPRRTIATVLVAFPIALIGFLPYLYLPMRANAGAAWVYGDPRTWDGLWHEFTGEEAAFLFQLPPDLNALLTDAAATVDIPATELTLPGLIAVLVLSGIAVVKRMTRRYALIALACSIGYVLWLVLLHRVVMPQAVAIPVVLYLVFMAALGLNTIVNRSRSHYRIPALGALAFGVLVGAWLVQYDWIHALTHEPTGVRAVALATHVPRLNNSSEKSAYMAAWGPVYTAVAFSHYVTGENANILIGDHKADWTRIDEQGYTIYTARDTLYRFPAAWFAERFNMDVTAIALSGAAVTPDDGLIRISIKRDIRPVPAESIPLESDVPIRVDQVSLCRQVDSSSDGYVLRVVWQATDTPDRDLSVFVHLLDANSDIPLDQADQSAPVFGWYPVTGWQIGEVVQDFYYLPYTNAATRVRYGLYEQRSDGSFVNYPAGTLPVTADVCN